MRFKVENLGPIREAEVDLARELIVLAGPNNSGKTYFAWAVYGFERFRPRKLRSIGPSADVLLSRPEEEHQLGSLIDVEGVLKELASDYSGAVDDEFAGVKEHYATVTIGVKGPSDGLHFPVGGFSGTQGNLQYVCRFSEDRTVRLVLRYRQERRAVLTETRVEGLTPDEREALRRGIADVLTDVIRVSLRERHKTIVFPVERLAINTFAKELAHRRSEFVDSLREMADDPQVLDLREALLDRVERYPRAIRDALHDATLMDEYRKQTSKLGDLADELESAILGGKVHLNDDNVLEFTPDRSTTTHLRIQQTASVVKSLASLVFFLRHRARGDERLIIDEPELNLHPDNQRKVARILAKMVNRGIQLIISTHSDYVIREFNNLIMLSQDSDTAREVAKELGIQPEMTLRPAQLGVHLFDVGGSCEEVEVSETGFEIETIDRANHELNHDAQTIFYRLFGDE
ncbi:MAG: AAA family ATPase [Nannocystaceae bacterium]